MGGRSRTLVLVTAAALSLVASCASGPQGEPSSQQSTSPEDTRPTPPSHGTPTVEAARGLPSFATGAAVLTDRGSGEWDLVLHDVRVAGHEGYDRVVLEFTGTGVAGWSVTYVDRARLDGSGEAVRLGGAAFLDIYASHTTWPSPDYYGGPRRLVPEDDSHVAEVYVGGTFEGHTQVIAGLNEGARPFRVFTLAQPSRLVIDVVHPGEG